MILKMDCCVTLGPFVNFNCTPDRSFFSQTTESLKKKSVIGSQKFSTEFEISRHSERRVLRH